MYHKTASSGEFLIRQGEEGNTFYVVESGKFVITVKDVGQVDTLTRGRCVGELALLYNAPRAASVQAISDGEVWAVDRGAFRKALMDVQIKSSDRNIEFLKKCELLRPCLSSELVLIDHFPEKEEDVAYKGDGDIGWDKDF